jgi:hypothetical protein
MMESKCAALSYFYKDLCPCGMFSTIFHPNRDTSSTRQITINFLAFRIFITRGVHLDLLPITLPRKCRCAPSFKKKLTCRQATTNDQQHHTEIVSVLFADYCAVHYCQPRLPPTRYGNQLLNHYVRRMGVWRRNEPPTSSSGPRAMERADEP